LRSLNRYVSHWILHEVVVKAWYSSSEDEQDVVVFYFDFQLMKEEPKKIQQLEVECHMFWQAAS